MASIRPGGPESPPLDSIQRALRIVRSHLGMDVAFVSEFFDDHRVLRRVDSGSGPCPIAPGQALSQRDGYCLKVVQGILPALIADTSQVPEAMAISATHEIPIGAHLSVPLLLDTGRIYGTFCCFSFRPDPSLNNRDLAMMRMFSDLVAQQISEEIHQRDALAAREERILGVLGSGGPDLVYQPCLRLSDMALIGSEALSRFPQEPRRAPDLWFAEAAGVGLGVELELRAIATAVEQYRAIWQRVPIYLGINASPDAILDGRLAAMIEHCPAGLVSLEITEHDHVEDYQVLNRALAPLRQRGVKLAVDDAGSGYASMRHILNLQPDVIKLDTSLTRDIDTDARRQALAAAIMAFGREIGTQIVAEGVETEAELETLRRLGAYAVQGYLLGRPAPLGDLGRRLDGQYRH